MSRRRLAAHQHLTKLTSDSSGCVQRPGDDPDVAALGGNAPDQAGRECVFNQKRPIAKPMWVYCTFSVGPECAAALRGFVRRIPTALDENQTVELASGAAIVKLYACFMAPVGGSGPLEYRPLGT